MIISNEPSHGSDKPKVDSALLQAASYRDLAHWIAILDLDPTIISIDDDFLDWMRRCGVEVRNMETDKNGDQDKSGVVVRGPSKAFLFINADTLELCNQQLEEVKPYWLKQPPSDEEANRS